MTATDELRRLLDEREVEWEAWNDRITVALPATHYLEITDGSLCVAIVDCTPAQAVEVTLERGMCRQIETEEGFIVCSECGAPQPEDYTVYYCWCCGRKVVDA